MKTYLEILDTPSDILAHQLGTKFEIAEQIKRVLRTAPELLNLLKEAQARLFVHCGNDELYKRITEVLNKTEGRDEG